MLIRNPVPWPEGDKCAVAVTFDLDADSILHVAHPEKASDFLSTQSLLRYGAEVSIPRICDVYRDLGLTQTFFVPGWCIERYPGAIEMILQDGHEIAHHGYLHHPPNQLSADEELYWFERAVAVFDRQIGYRPQGFRAPMNEFSKHTLRYLIDAGITYDSSLMGDDVPYLLSPRERDGEVLEIPQIITMDDWPHFMHNWDLDYLMPISSPQRAKELFLSEFDVMWENGGLWMTVWHPFLTGRPARVKMLIEMIEYMQAKGGVWFATLRDINAHVRQCMSAGAWTPRRDLLPYDVSPIPELSRPKRAHPRV